MSDREELAELYHAMYRAMIAKDEAGLEKIHDEDFVLIHMTGMHQDKQEYIKAIRNGTLNYYSEETDRLNIAVNEDNAAVEGCSRVETAVFGGGRHSWRLRLQLQARKYEDGWRFCRAEASVW